MFDPNDFDSCRRLFEKYGISLTVSAYDKLQRYAELLVAESAYQNVTAVKTLPEIWIRHFLDAAYLIRWISPHAKVVDIGTGGGIPAIPLAILSTFQITMLDSELRKIEFCQRAIKMLDISANAVCGRAEELARDAAYCGQFDYAVSRAMAAGSMLTELSAPFLKIGGSLLAMKGRQYDEQTERFANAAAQLGCEYGKPKQYTLENETKYLIEITKKQETPAQYPRRFAKIKRNPL